MSVSQFLAWRIDRPKGIYRTDTIRDQDLLLTDSTIHSNTHSNPVARIRHKGEGFRLGLNLVVRRRRQREQDIQGNVHIRMGLLLL